MTERERNLILDCDTGEDDALAMLVALQYKLPFHYLVTSYGNSTVENATRNTSRLLSYVGNHTTKVIRGSSRSLEPHIHKPEGESAGDFVGKNGLCNVELPEAKIPNIISPDESEFPKLLSDLIKNESPLDYIITGPSTNFAKACLHLGSSIKDYVKDVYVMGGAIHKSGNSGSINPQTGKEFAEFNFYCDPNAVDIVLDSGLPIHLVTWDITSTLTVPYDRISEFHGDTPVSEFSITLMKSFFKYYGLANDRNFELNDPITVMAKMGYGSYREERIRIITDGVEYGRSVLDPQGKDINYFYLNNSERNRIVDTVLRTLDIT